MGWLLELRLVGCDIGMGRQKVGLRRGRAWQLKRHMDCTGALRGLMQHRSLCLRRYVRRHVWLLRLNSRKMLGIGINWGIDRGINWLAVLRC